MQEHRQTEQTSSASRVQGKVASGEFSGSIPSVLWLGPTRPRSKKSRLLAVAMGSLGGNTRLSANVSTMVCFAIPQVNDRLRTCDMTQLIVCFMYMSPFIIHNACMLYIYIYIHIHTYIHNTSLSLYTYIYIYIHIDSDTQPPSRRRRKSQARRRPHRTAGTTRRGGVIKCSDCYGVLATISPTWLFLFVKTTLNFKKYRISPLWQYIYMFEDLIIVFFKQTHDNIYIRWSYSQIPICMTYDHIGCRIPICMTCDHIGL